MKLRPRYGLPVLLAALLASAALPAPWHLVLLVAAMGVALWTAFSLPKPPPREQPGSELLIHPPFEEPDAAESSSPADAPPDASRRGA